MGPVHPVPGEAQKALAQGEALWAAFPTWADGIADPQFGYSAFAEARPQLRRHQPAGGAACLPRPIGHR